MPELPEVEHFRQILLPLVGGGSKGSSESSTNGSTVVLECPPPLPTKRFPSEDVIELINQGCYVMKDVLRKGKVLCVILEKQGKDASSSAAKTKHGGQGKKKKLEKVKSGDDEDAAPITGEEPMLYLSLHMGMTGRISSPNNVPGLESLSEDDPYPPPHTHMIFKSSNGEEAAFSDPRRFGSVLIDVGVNDGNAAVDDSIPTFQDISQDALSASMEYCTAKKKSKGSESDLDQPTIVEKLMNRKKGIKGLLLDQRAVVSGVGNWVADEVLYRACIHPDQSYLNATESEKLVQELHHVLSTAVTCLVNGWGFPGEWLFHRRWRSGGGGGTAKDYNGKTITFIQSGGRSTAVVPSLQKHMGRKSLGQTKKTVAVKKKSSGKKKSSDEAAEMAKPKTKKTASANAKKLTTKSASAVKKPSEKAVNVKKKSTENTSKAQGQKRKCSESLEPKAQPTRRSTRRVQKTDFYV